MKQQVSGSISIVSLLLVVGVGLLIFLISIWKPNLSKQSSNIKLKDTQSIEMTVHEGVDCNDIAGLIRYTEKGKRLGYDNNVGTMKISNYSLINNPQNKSALDETANIINKGPFKSFQDLQSIEMAFRDYCGGHWVYFIRQIENINFPNTEQSIALMTITGQDLPGAVTIYILGRKDKNFIQISSTLKDHPAYNEHLKNCELRIGEKDFYLLDYCYKSLVLEDEKLYQFASKETFRLTNLFALQ